VAESPIIERQEVVALLFNISDIAEMSRQHLAVLGGDDAEEGEAD
jgi:hypothetical protein